MLGGGVLLARTIAGLVRATRDSVVANLPLQPDQTFQLPSAGPYDLYLEGNRLTSIPSGLSFIVTDSAGHPVEVRTALIRVEVSSFSRARLKLADLASAAGGTFRLQIQGLPAERSSDFRVLLARPIAGTLVLHVLALIALGLVVVGSLVASALLGRWGSGR